MFLKYSSEYLKINISHSNLVRRRRWHPTPVLLPGKSHGRRSLVGCSPWGREESDMTSLSLFTFMHWRRKWQATLVFLPGESQGRGSLVGCRLWGHTELDTTEATQQQQQQLFSKLIGSPEYIHGHEAYLRSFLDCTLQTCQKSLSLINPYRS